MANKLYNPNLLNALGEIGKDKKIRDKIIKKLLELENLLTIENFNVREEITGPLVDVLHQHIPEVNKTLSNGLKFSFPYSSKISRDFIMAKEQTPDHVWEPQTTKLLLKLACSAKHILIGGAYFGDHAIILALYIVSRLIQTKCNI
jgi:hypothetical protein